MMNNEEWRCATFLSHSAESRKPHVHLQGAKVEPHHSNAGENGNNIIFAIKLGLLYQDNLWAKLDIIRIRMRWRVTKKLAAVSV